MSNTFASRISQSRGWTVVVGVAAAVLAAVLLVVYLVQYRNSVDETVAPTPVLVAKKLIPKGSSGTVIGQNDLFQSAKLAKDDLKAGAIADPAYLQGRVTLADIFPGQQITAADLSVAATTALPAQISGTERAVQLPVDGSRALAGNLADGDRVDVYVALNVGNQAQLGLLASNIFVLRAPTAASASVIVRVSSAQGARLMSAVDNGRLWFVLRPQVGASKTPPISVAPDSLFVGLKPLPAPKGQR